MSIRVGGRSFVRPLSEIIYNNTLIATGRFDVTGIPPSYDYLIIKALLKSDIVAVNDGIFMLFNNDSTAANYRRELVESGAAGGEANTPLVALTLGASSDSDDFSTHHLELLEYAGAKRKTVRAYDGERRDATSIVTSDATLNWENTAAVTRIQIQPDGYPTDELVVGSRLVIIGMRWI